MKKILDRITEEMKGAFTAAGYDATYGKVTLSNRPDSANISVMAPWLRPKTIKRNPSTSQTVWWSI